MSEELTIRDLTRHMLNDTAYSSMDTEAASYRYGFPFESCENEFGDKKIDELTTEDVRKVLSESDKVAARNLFRSLDLIIQYGVLMGHGTHNPCDALRAELEDRQDSPSESRRSVQISPAISLTKEFDDDERIKNELFRCALDALEVIDDLSGYSTEDFEEFGRDIAIDESLRIRGDLEVLGFDGFQ